MNVASIAGKYFNWYICLCVLQNTLKKKFFENLFFSCCLHCIGHSSLSCGTLVCLLLVGNLFKTCIISVDLGKA